MTWKLALQAVIKFALGLAAMGALVFLPAGSFAYWQAWLLLGAVFLPMLLVGAWLAATNPQLLQKRLQAKEQRAEQSLVIACSALMFTAGFALAGLGFRLGWPLLPGWVSWGAAAALLAAFGLYARVLRENAYLSRTVEVQQGQWVIDTGPYRVVRHPMYSATILLFLCMPLVLGSPVCLAVFLAYPALLCRRIQNEEALLEQELEGYAAYKRRVKYKLLPFVW